MTDRRTIIVTGASRGIGLLAAKSLAAIGHHVFAAMRDIDGRNAFARSEVNDWAAESGHLLDTVEMDVTDAESVYQAVNIIEDRQPIDVLINNAGVMPVGVTEAYTLDQAKAHFDVNLFGAMRTCRAVLPHMRARKSGLIVHVSSTAGRLAIPFFGLYCAGKWALEAYAESLHYEVENFGIESVIVEPGGHATDLIKSSPEPSDLARIESYGPIAKGPGRMIGMFETMFAAGGGNTNAQNVADIICDLVAIGPPRPIRSIVGQDMGLVRINQRTAPVQAELIEGLKEVYAGSDAGPVSS